jgi:hypothetical protein
MGEVYFFGCLGQAGHYLHRARHWRTLDHHEAKQMRVPSDHALDGSAIFLPFPELKGNGALTYLPANDLTVLAWWGSPWDGRGAVNSAILVRGRHDVDAVWQAFEKAFPEFAPKMPRPTVTAGQEGVKP